MEQVEQLNYREEFNRVVSAYLENPDLTPVPDLPVLNSLIERFPFCQLLYLVRTAASRTDGNAFKEQLAKTAVYMPQRGVLFKALHRPEEWRKQLKEHLPHPASIHGENAEIPEEPAGNEPAEADPGMLPEDGSSPGTPAAEETTFTPPSANEGEPAPEEQLYTETSDNSLPQNNAAEPAATNSEHEAPGIETVVPEAETPLTEETAPEPQEIETTIPEAEAPAPEKEDGAAPAWQPETVIPQAEEPAMAAGEQNATKLTRDDIQAERMIIDSIAEADFFAFERSLADPLEAEHAGNEEPALENPGESAPVNREVSKYDDDKMPYTFLWWLSKTRKKHAQTYQPYVNLYPDYKKNLDKALNHQIIENIFHLKTQLDDPDYVMPPNTVEFEIKRKDDQIIERFLKEEPQIKPPKAEKIDTENKARKSSEDPNDVVSETLARIYSDQMLYYKAIDTYKKLSLKFPEKSAYFADQIKELEKKVN
ncbi:hypothetical protein [Hufsiella ginkgonis]|uniref:Tetratricopeptide repeat protein n=1 Tax=Hufsiella ginkgonis TaxID=2695274 RepID=A0A7K1Y3D2_9SPHI|nr:hypothetical protein [Hufsiella ginkgonis]MXV17549.1 hypothetical protein [Hufsiella ginkgonis]